MSLETQKKKNKHKYTLQPKTKTLSGARANGFGRQLIQKIRSIQKKNPNAQLTTNVQVEKKTTKKKVVVKKQKEGLQNPAFDPFFTNIAVQKHTLETIEENDDDEVLVKNLEREINEIATKKRKQQQEEEEEKTVKTKRRKKNENNTQVGFVNNGLDLLDGGGEGENNNAMEVKRGGGLTNPAFEEPLLDDSDLILNVTSAPPPPPQQQKIGYVNRGFNPQNYSQQQRIINARNAMENCGAEVENDINEQRYPMVGEMDGSDGENERVEEGTKLRYKYASFSHRTFWNQQNTTGPKKSYKHLIKGDIILAFKNTNLHEIQGYAVRNFHQNHGEKSRVRRVATVATSVRRTAVVKPATFVTKSKAMPLGNGVRRPKPFIGYNSQQFVKPRVPRFPNRRFHQNFGVNQGNFGTQQGNFDYDQQNFEYNHGSFDQNQENYGLNQEDFGPNYDNFHENQGNFDCSQENFDFDQGQNHENFNVNQGNFDYNQENFEIYQGNFDQNHQNFGPQQPNFGQNQQNFAPSQNFKSNQRNSRQNQRNFGPNQQNFQTNQIFRQNFPQNEQNFNANRRNFQQTQRNFVPQNQQFCPENQSPQNFQQFPQNQQQFVPQQNQRFSPMQRPKFMKPRRIVPSHQHNNQFYNKSPNGSFYNNQQGFQGGYENPQFYPQNNQQYN